MWVTFVGLFFGLRIDRSWADIPFRQTYLKFVLFRLAAPVLLIILGIVIGIHFPSYLSVYSRRPNVPVPLLPRSLPPPPLSLIPPTDSLPLPRDPIPNVVHYVYGLAPDPQPDFPYFAYLSMRSAMMVLKPEKIMFHCLHEPRGYWWDRVKNWEGWVDDQGDQKGMLEVVPARDVTHVGKDKRPVVHVSVPGMGIIGQTTDPLTLLGFSVCPQGRHHPPRSPAGTWRNLPGH